MPGNVKSLGTDSLSLAERVMFAGDIWDSIAAGADALEVPQSHKDELDLRIADYHANPRSGSTWENVKTRLRK